MAVIASCSCGQENRLPKKKVKAGSKVICGGCKNDLVVDNRQTEHVMETEGECDACGERYELADSDADHPKQFCSSDCEEEDDDQ